MYFKKIKRSFLKEKFLKIFLFLFTISYQNILFTISKNNSIIEPPLLDYLDEKNKVFSKNNHLLKSGYIEKINIINKANDLIEQVLGILLRNKLQKSLANYNL